MKTNMKDTSLDAYMTIQGNGVALNQKGKIYNYLKQYNKGRTRAEISEDTGVRINAVCGRVNELLKDGYVREKMSRPCTVTDTLAYPVTVI